MAKQEYIWQPLLFAHMDAVCAAKHREHAPSGPPQHHTILILLCRRRLFLRLPLQQIPAKAHVQQCLSVSTRRPAAGSIRWSGTVSVVNLRQKSSWRAGLAATRCSTSADGTKRLGPRKPPSVNQYFSSDTKSTKRIHKYPYALGVYHHWSRGLGSWLGVKQGDSRPRD